MKNATVIPLTPSQPTALYPSRCMEFVQGVLTEEWPRLEQQVQKTGNKGKVVITFELGYNRDGDVVLTPTGQTTSPKVKDEWIGEFSTSSGQLRLF